MKANEPLALVPDSQVKAVCLIGQGAACCRYLTCSGAGFECEKHLDLRLVIDQRVANGSMVSVGDNCSGITPGFPAKEEVRT